MKPEFRNLLMYLITVVCGDEEAPLVYINLVVEYTRHVGEWNTPPGDHTSYNVFYRLHDIVGILAKLFFL